MTGPAYKIMSGAPPWRNIKGGGTIAADKDTDKPVLPIRHGEETDNCKALRAAYAALATERDCNKSV
ncbi:MAG: hypothetical protein AAGC95_15260, partial [Pseudomonadota bacterium]